MRNNVTLHDMKYPVDCLKEQIIKLCAVIREEYARGTVRADNMIDCSSGDGARGLVSEKDKKRDTRKLAAQTKRY